MRSRHGLGGWHLEPVFSMGGTVSLLAELMCGCQPPVKPV